MATIVGDARFLGLGGYWLLAFLLLWAGTASGVILVWLRVGGADTRLSSLLASDADADALRGWLARTGLGQGAEPCTTTETVLVFLSFPASALAGWSGLPWQAESFLGHAFRGACWILAAIVVCGLCWAAAATIGEGAQARIASRIKSSADPRCRVIAGEWRTAQDAEVAEKIAIILASDDGAARTGAAKELRDLRFRTGWDEARAAGIDRLRKALADADARRLPFVLRALGLVGEPGVGPDVSVYLTSPDAATGTEAARALARLGDPAGLEALVSRVRFSRHAFDLEAEIFYREKFREPAEQSGRTLLDVPDDAWDNLAALVNGLLSNEEDISLTAASKLASVNPRAAIAPILGAAVLNRLLLDHERLPGRTILVLLSMLAALDPKLVAPRRDLVPAVRKAAAFATSAGVTTDAFSRIVAAHTEWARREKAEDAEFDRALCAAFEKGLGVAGAARPEPAPRRPRADLVEMYSQQVLQFLRDPKTLDYERENGAWWSREDLVLVLMKAGLPNDVPPEVFSEAAAQAVDELAATKRIVGTGSGYRVAPG